ncbi:MAG TPA: nucleotidyltransferase family protein [Cyclobacteriaceae bacterium]|nr:nucleotidyltransferase family protein [Cyclobacteriaceae bacterium]
MSVAILLLAAGGSTRMGTSKQLLDIGGVPLLVRSTQIALDCGASSVVVVLGAQAEVHQQAVAGLAAEVIVHRQWKNGMGSSLKAGLTYLLRRQDKPEAVMVLVCDQPRLTAQHLRALITTYRNTKKSIVASHYGGTDGVPALFDQSLFPELLMLPDEQGARKVIAVHEESVVRVSFPEGAIDLDTPEDYRKYKI